MRETRAVGAKEQLVTHPPRTAYIVDQVVLAGDLLWISGQVAMDAGELIATGALGAEIDLETGRHCARRCAANLLDRIREAPGGLESVVRTVKLTVYVASAPGFTEQHLVANGASELLVEVLGDAGRHARAAIGVAALPLGSPVEVEAVILMDPERALTADVGAASGVQSS